MDYIIVDLEATCWEHEKDREKMEIIEIGAVRMNEKLEILDSFDHFVRPLAFPTLSEFCTKLTTITQAQVDSAQTFPVVFPEFLTWIQKPSYWLCSWGNYDFRQFQTDCNRHGIAFPFNKQFHINLKEKMAKLKNCKPCGMSYALEKLGLPLIGTHHRGGDDAKNIARIAQILFKEEPQK